ncbi:hypothetical protein [Xenorhabdus innexi]|uniref:Uncharacterized protein n=1 Tax=Xenorhabdus innexi TaxID=290109 RepID=A0A1N6MWM1_9GAMM|nr:hypothetical protein [Xenorhabdus innexi]PHM35932.1 hypothetical protein Xinn_02002 [Xenorhabdus innexi]SIP73231.1 hypothetical protein XIS1_1790037 [Xenorhabdus innexi]
MIDNRDVPISVLKQHRGFQQFIKCLQQALADAREAYENTDANDFNRGRVAVLKEILNDLNE